MKSIDPSTGLVIGEYPSHGRAQADAIVAATHEAFLGWRRVSMNERAARMHALADVLDARRDEYAALMTREMGKVTREARAEVEKCAWVCRYYADHAGRFLADRAVATDMSRSFVSFQPIGTVLAIMPWNFPFWQVLRFAAPTLMAGNTAVLKHAPNVCGCALAIENAFVEAGFPPDVMRAALAPVEDVAPLIADERVRAVTLTGSTRAGRAVAAEAGRHLKKTVLELGGSDPYVILADADLGAAAATCATSRLINAGQSCVAAKRFIVVEAVHDAFVEALSAEMAAITFGDPSDPQTGIGPLARHDLRDALHEQVRTSVEQGARCVLGGEVPAGPGAFYPPTLLTDVEEGTPAYSEELFGPVASVIRVADAAEAVRVANDSPYGLGGAVFTQDTARGVSIARDEIDTGACFVNDFVRSDPRLPFGGVKNSGYGRELSEFGIHEFVNIKTVCVREPS